MATISGGQQLKRKLAEISKKLESGGTLRAGFLEGGTYPSGASLPMVAAIQEYGAPKVGIPPRPYFRPAVTQNSSAWGDTVARLIVADGYDARRTLERVGMVVKGDIQEAIVKVDSPPLSDVTLMLRKMRSEDQSLVVTGRTVGEAARRVAAGEPIGNVNTKPLQDSGFMKAHVDYEVRE